MRNTLLTSCLIATAAAAASSPAPTEAEQIACLTDLAPQLASAATCASSPSELRACLASLPSLSALESCFQSVGCPLTSAAWALSHCKSGRHELRARDPLAAIPTAAPHFMPLFGRQASSSASPSPCFTDQMVTITSCTTANGGAKTCFPAPSPSAVCRADLICKQDNQGNPSCMYKQSGMGWGGIVIAICFATALVVSVFSICFLCCKERREQTRLEKAKEAANIAKEAKTATAASKRPGRNVTGGVGATGAQAQGQPLMYEGGGAGGHGGDVGAGGQQAPGGYGSANPFVDSH
ncbi:hypothetical protein QBC42DRAFT_90430 [Cladorrhinum samala]|uniref:Uncharacterized protein n=1 Tax=Cladorrhinum samala TaxID=585594 RepID=A0AAV9I1W8_9PEZI|nr:hypothetical protein QBC42DRAFT_90430 [Cladorrhinum samala]